MFDERRRFDRCVFCAADPAPAALTAEHVFGKWLASRFQERFGALPNWVVAEEDSHGKGGGPILSVAPRLACAHCNNGVLSADMEASQEPLWRAIVGEHHVMTVADQRSIARYWDRVGIIAGEVALNPVFGQALGGKNDNVELLKAWAGTTLAFAIVQTGATSLLTSAFLVNLLIAAIVPSAFR